MELDEMKSYWNAGGTDQKTIDEIKVMLKENKHPVLRGIRRQITIEMVGFTAFLLCYYSMFDGQNKPMVINVMLIAALLAQLLHHLYGYHLSKHLVNGSSVSASLSNFIGKFSVYVFGSLLLRAMMLSALIIFFTYNTNFNAFRYYCLAAICVIFLMQMLLQYRIHAKRIVHLRGTLHAIIGQ
ncbi:hypothetical protein PBAL39_00687 [Pedobacter sp. BAL39]|uniref:hypothetical protein n=1 Tax=Pedobacter sp. BAL39 TaxID=391596 RepID=UPI0001559C8E|nr:hypothetical protein [Pedobacter sp. BAL39]EDM38086.1 hypothetical protein PBAL39_00687 [Pedobacter sp. BAL39]